MLKVTANAAVRAIVRAPKGVLLFLSTSTLALLGTSCAAEAPPSTVSGGTGGTSGGSAGAAGASAGAGAGGAAGTAGAAGSAGTAGAGGGSAGAPPACDYAGIIVASCARTACHDTMYSQAGLDLRMPGYEQRLVNAPATFTDITCPDPAGGPLPVPCTPPSCVQGTLLINTSAPADSWMLKKLLGTQGDCGKGMPIAPGVVTAEQRACLESWIHYLAGG